MKENKPAPQEKKKTWSAPKLFSLDAKKTEGGPVSSQTEDFASGTINTHPS
jgi:hypothetical protein